MRLLSGDRVAGVEPRITRKVLNDKRAWDALPILTPRFKTLFGGGTRWPAGWGKEPADYAKLLDDNYSLRPEFWPERVRRTYSIMGARERQVRSEHSLATEV